MMKDSVHKKMLNFKRRLQECKNTQQQIEGMQTKLMDMFGIKKPLGARTKQVQELDNFVQSSSLPPDSQLRSLRVSRNRNSGIVNNEQIRLSNQRQNTFRDRSKMSKHQSHQSEIEMTGSIMAINEHDDRDKLSKQLQTASHPNALYSLNAMRQAVKADRLRYDNYSNINHSVDVDPNDSQVKLIGMQDNKKVRKGFI